METFVLNSNLRTVTGKKVKNIRSAGKIPGIVFGYGITPTPVEVNYNEFDKVWRRAGSNTIVKLTIDGETRNVLIHEPTLDPIKSTYQHIDFYAVRMDKKIKAEVPIEFLNEAPAVTNLDGILITNKDALEVECLPADLPHSFQVDLSSLKTFEDVIRVSDIKAPPGVEILAAAEDVIALVNPPRSEEELAALDEAVEENVEAVEVEEKGKIEEEAEAPAEAAGAESPPHKTKGEEKPA